MTPSDPKREDAIRLEEIKAAVSGQDYRLNSFTVEGKIIDLGWLISQAEKLADAEEAYDGLLNNFFKERDDFLRATEKKLEYMQKLQIAEEALEFYAAGEKFVDFGSIKESEFYNEKWHSFGMRATEALKKIRGE